MTRDWHTFDMEPLDKKIVEQLGSDSSLSLTELSERLGIASSTLHQRIKRLGIDHDGGCAAHEGVLRK